MDLLEIHRLKGGNLETVKGDLLKLWAKQKKEDEKKRVPFTVRSLNAEA